MLGGVCLDAPHDTQQIAAQNAADLVVCVAAVDETLRDVRIAAHILKLSRQFFHPIEIRADADMFRSRDLGDMIDVIEQIVN